jgi:hypothetical protein
VTPDYDATLRAEIVKENGSVNTTNGSSAINGNGGKANWIVRTLFKCEVITTIHTRLADHEQNQDLHLTPEQKHALITLLEHKDALLALL